MSHQRTSAAADDRVGTQFGGYRIDALIGVGGMGKVYRALAGDRTPVALKLVKTDLTRRSPASLSKDAAERPASSVDFARSLARAAGIPSAW